MSQDFDVVGEGEDAIVLGAPARFNPAQWGRNLAAHRGAIAAPRPVWLPPAANTAGISAPKEEMDFLPFEAVVKTGVLASGSRGSLIALPQRPFRGERLIATATLVTAAGAVTDVLFSVLIDPAIFVGATQVGATQGQTPLVAFAKDAFGVRLSLPVAGQGTRIEIPITIGVPLAAGDSVTVSATLIGRAVR